MPPHSKEGLLPVTQEEVAWRCFHCGEVFTDERCARLHFGRDEDSQPACIIKAGAEQGLLGALRAAEYEASDARRAIADECTDAARAYYAQASRHDQALRNAEELGYERGLADGRALSPCGGEELREAFYAESTVAHDLLPGTQVVAIDSFMRAVGRLASSPPVDRTEAGEQYPEKWSGPLTVGNMIANLRTLPPEMPIHSAYHLIREGQPTRLFVKHPTVSRERVDGREIKTGDESVPYSAVIWSHEREPSAQPLEGLTSGEGAFPTNIGRLHLGERRSDGERLCSHSHAVPAGHPLYWPEQISQYDDNDPLCLEHAIEQAVDDNGYCEKCTGAEFAASPATHAQAGR